MHEVEVEVLSLCDLPQATSYLSAADVLEDVQRFHAPARDRRSTARGRWKSCTNSSSPSTRPSSWSSWADSMR